MTREFNGHFIYCSSWKLLHTLSGSVDIRKILTRTPFGGGRAYFAPLPHFHDNSRTMYVSTQNFRYIIRHELNVFNQNFTKESVNKFLKNDILMTPSF